MRNRGVEIFMSNPLSTFLWESVARRSHVEEGRSTTYDDTSTTPMEVETVTGNNPPSEQNDNTNVE